MAKKHYQKNIITQEKPKKVIVVTSKKQTYLLIISLIVITFIAFSPSLKNGFVDWDDISYISNNVNTFENHNIFYYFGKQAYMGNYHPFTMALYDIQYSLFGLNPFYFHFTNLFLHIINSLLVFWLILKITDKKIIWAFVTSIFFAIHPLHVESVTWISELKDVLYTMYFLLAIIFYQFYDDKLRQKMNYISSKKYYAFSLILFLCACFSKGMAVTLPIALILIDFYKDQKITVNKILNKIPFFAISLIFGIIAVYAQTISSAVKDLSNYTVIERIIFPVYSSVFYIFKLFLPINLTIFYPYPESGSLNMFFWLSPIILILIGFTVFKFRKSNFALVFGILLYFAMILPVIQIKPIGETIVSERYFYVSSIGLFFIIGYFIDFLYEKFDKKYRQFIFIPVIIYGLLSVYLTFERTKDWKNTQTLWQSAIDVNPDLDKGYYGVGNVYYMEKNYTEAKKYFIKALEKNPENYKANNNLGNIFYNSENYDSAFYYYQQTVNSNNKFAQGYYNLGNIYFIKNELKTALKEYQKAIDLEPDNQQYLTQYNNTFIMLQN